MHTDRTTMDYLKKEHINFIEPHIWHPNSPDINPVDNAIWGALRQRVYQSMNGVDVLKQSRTAADTWSMATWLEQPHIILMLSRDKFSQ